MSDQPSTQQATRPGDAANWWPWLVVGGLQLFMVAAGLLMVIRFAESRGQPPGHGELMPQTVRIAETFTTIVCPIGGLPRQVEPIQPATDIPPGLMPQQLEPLPLPKGDASPFGDGMMHRPRRDMRDRPLTYFVGSDYVYCLDASGSMIDVMPMLRAQMLKAIAGLVPGQRFAIVAYQDDRVAVFNTQGGELKRKRDDSLEEARQWLEDCDLLRTPRGRGDVTIGLAAARALEPDLIFLFSDDLTHTGRFEVDQQQVLHSLVPSEGKAAHPKVFAFGFLHPDPLTRCGQTATLDAIAQATGGFYRFVDAVELGLPPRSR